MKLKVFWEVTLCRVANNYRRFRVGYCLVRQVPVVQEVCSVGPYVPEDGITAVHEKVGCCRIPDGLHFLIALSLPDYRDFKDYNGDEHFERYVRVDSKRHFRFLRPSRF
jgi:hypothetical protein